MAIVKLSQAEIELLTWLLDYEIDDARDDKDTNAVIEAQALKQKLENMK